MSSWIKALQEVVKSAADKVPKGWKTILQISIEINRDETTAAKIVKKLKAKNLVDTQDFKVERNGKLVKVAHYKLKKK